MSCLTFTKLSVGPMDNNAYLLRCTSTGEGLLIDAANDAERLLELIGTSPEGISTVVTTHRHQDHWFALEEVVEATGAASLAHAADAPEIPGVTGTLADGDTISLGDCELTVTHLVGHTPGSIALYHDGHLWTGDALFPGGPGRTTNPADFKSLMDDLEAKIFGVHSDETVIHPGHGKDSTLGAERPSIPEWRARGW
jgi:glyoxylase-like metal-dependent hydrolase (beta-lactamase superfamily II)